MVAVMVAAVMVAALVAVMSVMVAVMVAAVTGLGPRHCLDPGMSRAREGERSCSGNGFWAHGIAWIPAWVLKKRSARCDPSFFFSKLLIRRQAQL